MNLSKVSWISSRNATQLRQLGIRTTKDLLRLGNNADSRAIIAEKVGVTQRKVLSWVRSADLSRVNGIGDDYVMILTRSKIYTPNDLAQQELEYLLTQIEKVNSTYRLVRRMPASSSVSKWIKTAQKLPSVVCYQQ